MAVTAKVKCTSKTENADGSFALGFNANYADDNGNRLNEEWAVYTPHCFTQMTVVASVGELFEPGKAYTLSFQEE